MIISASRRCDILAYNPDFLESGLKKGFVEVQNPFNPKQIRKVSLLKTDVTAFVFWTRNALPSLSLLKDLEKKKYPFYLMITFTNYPKILEKNSPFFDVALKNFVKLSEIFSKERIILRYDPILFSNFTDKNFHLKNFRFLVENLHPYTNRVILSLFDPYKFVLKKMAQIENLKLQNFREEEIIEFLSTIKSIAQNFSIETQSCCEGEIFEKAGIKRGACIDATLLNKLFYLNLHYEKDKNQRKECLCQKSVDIGKYNTCLSNCVYCYANKKLSC